MILIMKFAVFAIASILSLEGLENRPTEGCLLQAKRLYESGSYQESLSRYQEALNEGKLTEAKQQQIQQALTKSTLQAGQLAQAEEMLSDLKNPLLLSVFYEETGQRERFLETLQQANVPPRYLAKAYYNLNSSNKALEVLKETDDRESIYLRALLAAHLSREDPSYASLAEEGLKKDPESLYELGTLYFQQSQFEKAKEAYLSYAEAFPDSPLAGDALFYSALSLEKLNQDSAKSRELLKRVFEQYPQSSTAPLAYLTYYPYTAYLFGSIDSLSHLQKMPQLFPKAKELMYAYYLIGLHAKKKNSHRAIDAFQKAESHFDELSQEDRKLIELILLKMRCMLERAQANLAIATESKGAKQKIYHAYAVELLREILSDTSLYTIDPYPTLIAESEYQLARALLDEDPAEAEKIFDSMIEKYRKQNITRGLFLSRAWYEKAMRVKSSDPEHSLKLFLKAEESGKGRVLSADQLIDLWIQESLCYKALKKYDDAMRILSKAINADLISNLRLKAMFLRAELYEMQGRKELAEKQLEALANKSGQWAQLAQEKLKEEYGR